MEEKIEVWLVDLDQHTKDEEFYFSILSDEEKARALRFVTKQLTSRYVISQGALRTILGKYTNQKVEYTFGPYKKPYLANSSLQFNLSHSHDKALIAISDEEVGVDIEKINRQVLEKNLETSLLSEQELKIFESIPLDVRPEVFYFAWTNKEALLKLAGVGLYKPMTEFQVLLHHSDSPSMILFEDKQYYVKSFRPWPEFIAAVATAKQHFDLAYKTFAK